jgi:hypothetical protein
MYLNAEDIAVIAAGRVGDQVRDAFAAVGRELLKEHFRLGFGEGTHRMRLYVVRTWRSSSCFAPASRT